LWQLGEHVAVKRQGKERKSLNIGELGERGKEMKKKKTVEEGGHFRGRSASAQDGRKSTRKMVWGRQKQGEKGGGGGGVERRQRREYSKQEPCR